MDISQLLDRFMGRRPGGGSSIDPRMGGSAGVALDLRKVYDEYAMQAMSAGDEPLSWEDWLPSQGYQFNPSTGQVMAIPDRGQTQGRPTFR